MSPPAAHRPKSTREVPSARPDLSVLVVNWNTREILRDCLASIAAGAPGISTEVILVDNASSDGSAEMVASEFPEVTLIRNSDNLGFSKANNQAIEVARGELVLLLNSDTVVHPEALTRLVRFMEAHPEIDGVGPKLLNPDGTVQREGFYRKFPTLAQVVLFYTPLRRIASRFPGLVRSLWEDFDERTTMEIDQIPGAALCTRASVIEKIGALEERFPIWFEDVDWCYRARRSGAKLVFYPDSVITHLGGQSFSMWAERAKMLQLFSSMYLFFRLHHGVVKAEAMRAVIFSASALSVGFNFIRKWLHLPGFRSPDYEARKWLLRNFAQTRSRLQLPGAR